MIKLIPILKSYIWGGNKIKTLLNKSAEVNKVAESWEASIHPNGLSRYEKGLLSDYLKIAPYMVDKNGTSFPLIIKYIDANEHLSIQVHPNDEQANGEGKAEAWYIMQADSGAGIFCGFKRSTNRLEIIDKLKNNSIEEILNFIPVKAGDFYYIEPGTVHAIGKGCLVCEIQQNSDITYRLYDFNRIDGNGQARELHISQALKIINFNKYNDSTSKILCQYTEGIRIRQLINNKYFYCRELRFKGKYRELNSDSFTIINIIDGSGLINAEDFKRGDSFFIPCNESFIINGEALVLLTCLGKEPTIK